MLRFVVKEVYVGHVVHAQGQPETRLVSFDGNLEELERFLRFKDGLNGGEIAYTTRQLVGVELL
jgi:hypothetical protein